MKLKEDRSISSMRRLTLSMNKKNPSANDIRKLEWDSQFFGFPIGRLHADNMAVEQLGKILEHAGQVKPQFIELFCDISDHESIFSCENSGFHLADVRILFKKNPLVSAATGSLPEGLCFKKADDVASDQLKKISKSLFENSRYYRYRKFDRERIDLLFQTWIEKAVLGEFDDECYCIFDDAEILAFCSLKYNGHAASIGLFGVNPGHKNRGLGTMLLSYVFDLLFNRGITGVTCITQGRNSGAMRLYQENGFTAAKLTLCYYRWLE